MEQVQHDIIAWQHCLAQFDHSPKFEALVKSLYQPLNRLQTAYIDLLDKRHLETAEGVQLDGIGQIVGLPREMSDSVYSVFFGFDGQPQILSFRQARLRRQHESHIQGNVKLNDAEYRRLLAWKIAINNGYGTMEQIAHSVQTIFKTADIRIRDAGNAKIHIWLQATRETNSTLLNKAHRWIPKAGGVGVEMVLTSKDKAFGFVSQGLKGFNRGQMARAV